MKGKKKKNKSTKMVTKVSKDTKKEIPDDKEDQNFFEKPQMLKASIMAPPDAANENFKKKIYEVVVDGTNMDNNNDLQDMEKMMEELFQLKFKTNWERCIEKQKLEHPTLSFSYSSTEKSTVMFLKCQDEQLKLRTYQEMLKQELKEHTMTQEKLILLMNRLKSLLKEKPVHSETEAKVVDAVIEKNEATVRYHEIKM